MAGNVLKSIGLREVRGVWYLTIRKDSCPREVLGFADKDKALSELRKRAA